LGNDIGERRSAIENLSFFSEVASMSADH
jgi:hypothetical protein